MGRLENKKTKRADLEQHRLLGFLLGVVGIVVLLATTRPLVGKGYLYPLFPFDAKALKRLLVREPISRDNT